MEHKPCRLGPLQHLPRTQPKHSPQSPPRRGLLIPFLSARIDFGVHSEEEICRMSVVEVKKDEMYSHAPAAPGQPMVRQPVN